LFKLIVINLKKTIGLVWGTSLIVLSMLFTKETSAQFRFNYADIPVAQNNLTLQMPWAGGINSAQYNAIDLNDDGQKDLIIFDRTTNKLTTFLWLKNSYVYSPEYESFFPGDLTSWMLLRDYDCDGDQDLFTDGQQGLRVFENIGIDNPEWELATDPLLTLGTQIINLFFNDSDIPAIEDLDNDGDLDILAYNFATGTNIDYHRNQSVENTGECGLDFVRITRIYGDINECDCGFFNFGEPCPVNGRIKHTGGKAMIAIDLDNDGDKEILSGEETCNNLTLLFNQGNETNASFNGFSNFFDQVGPATGLRFPASFSLDINHDGPSDLMVSSNFRSNIDDLINFQKTSFFYQNIGSNELPEYQLIEEDFLQKEMIDIGEEAHPVFADYDNDGDQDMFVGNRGAFINGKYLGTIYLYENTGTLSSPGFELITDDYAALSSLEHIDIKPQFVDLNNDNSKDLVWTSTDIDSRSTAMYYLLNSTTNNVYSFDISGRNQLTDIPSLEEYPTLADIDEDGILDLLAGRSIGTLELYINHGSNLVPNFQIEDPDFMNISTSIERINLVPLVHDLDRNGNPDLITTDGSGEISIYTDFLIPPTTPERRILLKDTSEVESEPTNLGRITWPAVTDLYSSGNIDLFVGTIAGGVLYLQDTSAIKSIATGKPVLDVFPNPATIGQPVSIRSNRSGEVRIFDLSGKRILSDLDIGSNQTIKISLSALPAGIYLVHQITSDNKRRTQRLVIE